MAGSPAQPLANSMAPRPGWHPLLVIQGWILMPTVSFLVACLVWLNQTEVNPYLGIVILPVALWVLPVVAAISYGTYAFAVFRPSTYLGKRLTLASAFAVWLLALLSVQLSKNIVLSEGYPTSKLVYLLPPPFADMVMEDSRLAPWRPAPTLEEIAIGPQRDTDAFFLDTAARQLGSTAGPEETRELLATYYAQDSVESRARLAAPVRNVTNVEALGILRDELSAIAARPPSVHSAEPIVEHAVFALSASGDSKNLEFLLGLVDSLPEVSMRAGLVGAKSYDYIPLVFSSLDEQQHASPRTKKLSALIWILGQIESERVRDRLETMIHSPDEQIRTSALEAKANLKALAPALYTAIGQ